MITIIKVIMREHSSTLGGTRSGLKLKLSLNTGRAFTLHHRRRNMFQMLRFSPINITFFWSKMLHFSNIY